MEASDKEQVVKPDRPWWMAMVPVKQKRGLIVRPEARRYKVGLFPLDSTSFSFILEYGPQFGVMLPHGLHQFDGRMLHIHPAYDVEEVVNFFESYNDQFAGLEEVP